MTKFTESRLESTIITLLEAQGYPYTPGADLDAVRQPSEVLLKDDLRQFLSHRYAADKITPGEIDSIVRQLGSYPAADLYGSNKAIHKLVSDNSGSPSKGSVKSLVESSVVRSVKTPVKTSEKTSEKMSEKTLEALGNRLGNQLGNRLGGTKVTILQEMIMNQKISGKQWVTFNYDTGLKDAGGGAAVRFGDISERIRKKFRKNVAQTFEVVCQHPEFSAEQIGSTLRITSRTVENHLAKLKGAGILRRLGPNLGGTWEVIND